MTETDQPSPRNTMLWDAEAKPRWGRVLEAVADNWQSDMENVAEAIMHLIWPEGGWDRDLNGAARVARDVRLERLRQDEKWGQQNHPDGTGPGTVPAWYAMRTIDFGYGDSEAIAEVAKINTDDAAREGKVTWAHITLEEFAEALAESDLTKLRTELIQLAAVAQQWAEAIDRRTA